MKTPNGTPPVAPTVEGFQLQKLPAFCGPDGNQRWVTGNSDNTEGLPVDYLITDNVDDWSSPADPPRRTTLEW